MDIDTIEGKRGLHALDWVADALIIHGWLVGVLIALHYLTPFGVLLDLSKLLKFSLLFSCLKVFVVAAANGSHI